MADLYMFTKWESKFMCIAVYKFAVKVDWKSSKSAEYKKGTDAEIHADVKFL